MYVISLGILSADEKPDQLFKGQYYIGVWMYICFYIVKKKKENEYRCKRHASKEDSKKQVVTGDAFI